MHVASDKRGKTQVKSRLFLLLLVIRINKFLQTDFTEKINVKKERRFDRPTVIFKFMIKSKISVCLYTIVRGLMRY